jgi:hypothetical protein
LTLPPKEAGSKEGEKMKKKAGRTLTGPTISVLFKGFQSEPGEARPLSIRPPILRAPDNSHIVVVDIPAKGPLAEKPRDR